jgi:hypothetical protein
VVLVRTEYNIYYLGDLGVDGNVTLKWILKKKDGRA